MAARSHLLPRILGFAGLLACAGVVVAQEIDRDPIRTQLAWYRACQPDTERLLDPSQRLDPGCREFVREAAARLERLWSELDAERRSEARRDQVACYLSRLQGDVDDRVIQWRHVCGPTTPNAILTQRVEGCPESWKQTHDRIQREVDSANDIDRVPFWFVTRLGVVMLNIDRFLLELHLEDEDPSLEERRRVVESGLGALDIVARDVNLATHNLNMMTLGGGGQSMFEAYRPIREWIARQQRNGDSLYACHATGE